MVHEYKYWSCYCKQRPWSHVMLWWPLKITTCMKQLLCSNLVTRRSGPVLPVWPVRPWWYHFPSRIFGWVCCTSKLTLTGYVAIFYSKSPTVCIIHVLISFAHDFILYDNDSCSCSCYWCYLKNYRINWGTEVHTNHQTHKKKLKTSLVQRIILLVAVVISIAHF